MGKLVLFRGGLLDFLKETGLLLAHGGVLAVLVAV